MTPERGPDGKFQGGGSNNVAGDDDDAATDFRNDAGDVKADDADDGLNRDESGGLIDPPTIPSFERELAEAHALGDDATIQEIQGRYEDAREDKARALAVRDQEDDQ